MSAPSLTAVAPLKLTTKTNVAVAVGIMRSVRVAFVSAAESGAAQNNFDTKPSPHALSLQPDAQQFLG